MECYMENEDLIENVFEAVEDVCETQLNIQTKHGGRCKKPQIPEQVSNEKIYKILKDLEKYKTGGKIMCPFCKDNNTLYIYGTLRRHVLTLHGNINKDILHQCYRCQLGFPSAKKLTKHLKNYCQNFTKNTKNKSEGEKNTNATPRRISKIFEIISLEKLNEILENFKDNTTCNIICPICKDSEKRFSIGSLRRHLLIMHRNENKAELHSCPNCNECFSSYMILEKHNRQHHPQGQKHEKIVICRSKTKPIISRPEKISSERVNEILKDLEKYKTIDGKILCPICKENMKRFCSLRRHLLIQHGNVDKDLIYQCSKCNKGFTNKNKLVQHKNCLLIAEDDVQRKTYELNEVEEQNVISDIPMENDDISKINEQTISCDVLVESCEINKINDQNNFDNAVEQQTFKNDQKVSNSEIIRFISTIRTNSSTKLFHCPFCETKLILKSSLKHHMIRDHSIKGSKIKCYICDIGFKNKSLLKQHEQCGRHKRFEKRLRNPKQLITELEIQPVVNANNDLKEADESEAKKSIVVELPSENINGEISNFEGYYFEEDEIFDMKEDGFFHCPYCPKILERASHLRRHIERHTNSANDVLKNLKITKQRYFENIETLRKARKATHNLENRLQAANISDEIDPIAIADNNIQLEEIFTQNNDNDAQLEDIFGKEQEEDNSVTVINEVDKNSIGEEYIENCETEEISREKENIQEQIIDIENIKNENLIENHSEIIEEVYGTQLNKLKTTETEFIGRRELKFKKCKKPKMFEKVGNEKVYEILEDLEKYKTEGKIMCPICKDKNDKKYVYGALCRHLLTLHGNTDKDILHQCFKCKQGFSNAKKLRKHMNEFCRNTTKNYFWPMQECYTWEKRIKTESRKIFKINNINNYETETKKFTEEIGGESENIQEQNIEVENMEICEVLETKYMKEITNEQSKSFKNISIENIKKDENYNAVVGNSEEVFTIEYLNENENILEEVIGTIPEKFATKENINQSCSEINENSTTFLKEELYKKKLEENEIKIELLKQQKKIKQLIDFQNENQLKARKMFRQKFPNQNNNSFKKLQTSVKTFIIEKPNEVNDSASKLNGSNKNQLTSTFLKLPRTQNKNTDASKKMKKRLKMIYQCMFCDKISSSRWANNRHMKTHTGEKPYQCSLCPTKFSTKHGKLTHEIYHKKDRIFPCTLYCKKSFCTLADRKRHEQRCLRTLNNKTKINKIRIENTDKSVRKKKVYQCMFCDKICPNKSRLECHLKVHTGEKPYQCSFCPKKFIENYSKNIHERRHKNEKNFLCSICNEAFCTSFEKKRHEESCKKRPNGKRLPPKLLLKEDGLYHCNKCVKVYSTSKSMRRHYAMHINGLKCPKCDQTFSYESGLKRHLTTPHTVKNNKFLCTECGKTYSSKQILDIHLKCHNNEGLTCTICKNIFLTHLRLANHMRRIHKIENLNTEETDILNE